MTLPLGRDGRLFLLYGFLHPLASYPGAMFAETNASYELFRFSSYMPFFFCRQFHFSLDKRSPLE